MENMGKRQALRVLAGFWSDLDQEPFEAQVLDGACVIINVAPSLVQHFNAEYIEFCMKSKAYNKPARTAYGKQIFNACVALKLIDLQGTILGGMCGGQFGWPSQQLHSVDIRRLSADELSQTGLFHWYSVKQFTKEQLEWVIGGGIVRHTFGIFDVENWVIEEVFEIIED